MVAVCGCGPYRGSCTERSQRRWRDTPSESRPNLRLMRLGLTSHTVVRLQRVKRDKNVIKHRYSSRGALRAALLYAAAAAAGVVSAVGAA